MALERRMRAREEHLAMVQNLKESGNFIWGGAILDDSDKMVGSVIVYDFESREELENMLKTEPYIKGDVWQNIKIENFRLANIQA
jgi:uncharacterized protein YciI